MTGVLIAYWRGLSVREQGLVLAASLLISAMLVWLVIVQPLVSWRDSARAVYADNAVTYFAVANGIARLNALQGADTAAPAGEREPVRSAVAGAASQAGIVLSRVLPDEAGRLNIWIDAAEPVTLMRWLEALSRDHGVVVVRANLEQTGAGPLRAQLLLARGGA